MSNVATITDIFVKIVINVMYSSKNILTRIVSKNFRGVKKCSSQSHAIANSIPKIAFFSLKVSNNLKMENYILTL